MCIISALNIGHTFEKKKNIEISLSHQISSNTCSKLPLIQSAMGINLFLFLFCFLHYQIVVLVVPSTHFIFYIRLFLVPGAYPSRHRAKARCTCFKLRFLHDLWLTNSLGEQLLKQQKINASESNGTRWLRLFGLLKLKSINIPTSTVGT